MEIETADSLLREIRNDYRWRLGRTKDKHSRGNILVKLQAVDVAITAVALMEKPPA